MKIKTCAFVVALLSLFLPEVLAGNLKVNLAPTQAVNAGAQWRVDGGAWKSSGATVNGLSNGAHQVTFQAVNGWTAPQAANVTITNGTNTFSYTYAQAASLKITLTPTTAQWRVDGGSWQASGATIANLPAGNHTVDYAPLSGYADQPSEILALAAGQALAVNRSFTPLASFSVNLNPTSAQWRLDGSGWQNSGAVLTNLSLGSHSVEYAPLAGYVAPSTESITLVSGSNPPLSRTYAVAPASLTVNLTPAAGQWRVDGGAWRATGTTATGLSAGSHLVEYLSLAGYISPSAENVALVAGQTASLSRAYTALAQLSVTLTPATAQWRVDGGAWLNSGAIAGSLAPGSHTIDYGSLTGYTAPVSESVSLAPGQSLGLNRSYVALPAQVSVTLNHPAGAWQLDGGAWQSSGSTVGNLPAGSHTLAYSAVQGQTAPAPESINLSPGQSLTLSRAYTAIPDGQVSVNLAPSAARWNVNNGAWQSSGSTVSNVPVGDAVVAYESFPGFVTPPSETITVIGGVTTTLSRSYVRVTTLTITLNPNEAQWRVDGGSWRDSGTVFAGISAGAHTIEYSQEPFHGAPPTETVTLAAGDQLAFSRTYTPLTQINMSFTPDIGQWRLDGGDWRTAGLSEDLAPGNHAIDYLAVPGYTAPSSETISLVAGQTHWLSRSYVEAANFSVTLTPGEAQWRLDGGVWQASGATVHDLPIGEHLLEFSPLSGYTTPAQETVTLVSGDNPVVSRNYTLLASLNVSSINPPYAQWRLDGGAWNTPNNTLFNLSLGAHTVEFSPVEGYITPAPLPVTLVSGINSLPAVAYTPLASLNVSSINPPYAQWRVDGGAWNTPNNTLFNLSLGAHTVEFSPVEGYITPAPVPVTLVSGFNSLPAVTYTPLASLYVNSINPSFAQWRLDGGAWNTTYTTLFNLSLGAHTVEFMDLDGYITPAPVSITLISGINSLAPVTYTPLASLYVNSINPSFAQWRLDGGAWNTTYTSLYNLSLGAHIVEFSPLDGYITPAPVSITLTSGINSLAPVTYTPLASLYVSSINPSFAQWRLDGGAWNTTYTSLYNLSLGTHTIEFSDVYGYLTPPAQTITLVSGSNYAPPVNYTPLATLYVSLNPSYAQWRLDGGSWNSGYTSLGNLSLGAHTIEYSAVEGYGTPAAETITLTSGSNYITRSYAAAVDFSVVLTPSFAQWRMDGGRWYASGTVVHGLDATGTHVIEFSHHEGYLTPEPFTVGFSPGYNMVLTKNYDPDPAFSIDSALAIVSVVLDPTYAEWRLDGGDWNVSGATLHNLSVGTHTIEYKPVDDYLTPPAESVTLVAGNNPTIYTDHISLDQAQLTVTTNPASGQWRAYLVGWPASGAWIASGASASLNPGTYTVEYAPVTGYTTPVPGTVALQPNGSGSLSANYGITNASLRIFLNPATARYRIDGGIWRSGSANWLSIAPGTRTIEFEPVAGYLTPSPVTITLGSGDTKEYTFNYTPQ